MNAPVEREAPRKVTETSAYRTDPEALSRQIAEARTQLLTAAELLDQWPVTPADIAAAELHFDVAAKRLRAIRTIMLVQAKGGGL